MKVLLAALLASLSLIAVEANMRNAEGFHYEHRDQTGHFKEEPFVFMYKNYAVAFEYDEYNKRDHDDFRNYVPAAETCIDFFNSFKIDKYVLSDIQELIKLDACLGYLYESKYHANDRENNKFVDDNLDAFINDEELKRLYDGAKIEQLSNGAQSCIGNLLFESVQIKKQYKDVTCNNHYLEMYTKFAKCQKEHLPAEFRKEDTYGQVIYDILKRRAQECFDAEIFHLNSACRGEYLNNPFYIMKNSFGFSMLHRQAGKRYWPPQIKLLLGAVEGVLYKKGRKRQINMREVHAIVRGVGMNRDDFKERLAANMAEFANHQIAPRRRGKSTKEDPNGSKRYEALVNDVCNFFRTSDRERYYDYATSFTRLIEVLNYPEVFDIPLEYFREKVLIEAWESAPIYLSVSACNILTFTQAKFIERPHNNAPEYQVFFKPDTSGMIIWPSAGFF